MALTVLVCYDISSDSARAKVAGYLQWGDRIQRSVFVCAVSPDDLSEMVGHVEQMIDPVTDAVHLLPTCAVCWSKLIVRGQADTTPDKPYWAAL